MTHLPLLLLLLLAGCSKPETQFLTYVHTLQRTLATNEMVRPIRYDVRRTSSLVSPVVGEIESRTITHHTEGVWAGEAWRYHLAYQDGSWKLVGCDWGMLWSWKECVDWHPMPLGPEARGRLGIAERCDTL